MGLCAQLDGQESTTISWVSSNSRPVPCRPAVPRHSRRTSVTTTNRDLQTLTVGVNYLFNWNYLIQHGGRLHRWLVLIQRMGRAGSDCTSRDSPLPSYLGMHTLRSRRALATDLPTLLLPFKIILT